MNTTAVEKAIIEVWKGDEQMGEDARLIIDTVEDTYHSVDEKGEVSLHSRGEAIAHLRGMQRAHDREHTNWCGTPNPGQKPYMYGTEEACKYLGIPEDGPYED